jgi:hypothetical protein
MERCTFATVLRIGYNYPPPVIRQLLSLSYVMNKILIRFSTFIVSGLIIRTNCSGPLSLALTPIGSAGQKRARTVSLIKYSYRELRLTAHDNHARTVSLIKYSHRELRLTTHDNHARTVSLIKYSHRELRLTTHNNPSKPRENTRVLQSMDVLSQTRLKPVHRVTKPSA